MSAGAERILERAANIARAGERNPHIALIRAGEQDSGDDQRDEGIALLALLKLLHHEGILAWFTRVNPTPEQTAELLEETLFRMQLGGWTSTFTCAS